MFTSTFVRVFARHAEAWTKRKLFPSLFSLPPLFFCIPKYSPFRFFPPFSRFFFAFFNLVTFSPSLFFRFFGFYRLFHLVTVGAWNLSSTAFFLIMLIEIFKAHTRFLVQGVKGKYKYKRNKKMKKNKEKYKNFKKKPSLHCFFFLSLFSFLPCCLLWRPLADATKRKELMDHFGTKMGPFWGDFGPFLGSIRGHFGAI